MPDDSKQPVIAKEFNHYYRKCPYDYIDVYRVLELFNITSPARQHAIKKLLVTGIRGGGKDEIKDLEEAIASLRRDIEMIQEREQHS